VGPKFVWIAAFGGRIVWISCILVLVVLLSLRHFAEPARRRLTAAFRFRPEACFQRVERFLTALVQGVESTRSDAALLPIFVYSVPEGVLIAACYWCVVQASAGIVSLTFVDVLILMGFVPFRGVVQIPGTGGGRQVAAALELTELFGTRLGTGDVVRCVLLDNYICSCCARRFGAGTKNEAGLAQPAATEPGGGEMKCPFCNYSQDKVVDSRESKEGDAIRRRRECLSCERRFTTYERIDEVPYMVIKKDGRREKFDRQKVLGGLLKACEKRPVGMARLSEVVNQVESKVSDSPDREISTIEIGEFLMDSLRDMDKIAYVRFASVYRDFQDEQAFFNELKNLMRHKLP